MSTYYDSLPTFCDQCFTVRKTRIQMVWVQVLKGEQRTEIVYRCPVCRFETTREFTN